MALTNGNPCQHDSVLLGPSTPFGRDRSVLDLFLDQVATSPDSPAVRFRDLTLSYRELRDRSLALAAAMAEAGGDGDLVPLLVDGGVEFPVTLFATAMTGRAFVPLDPGWPAQRLRDSLAQLDAPLLVTAPALVEIGQSLVTAATRMVTADATHDAPPSAFTMRAPGPEDLIYGFYTSGSSGTPKCALNHHRGLVNRLTAMSRRFGAGGQVILQNSRTTFDSAMWQVLWPLTSGGTVVLPDRDGILDLDNTIATIARYGVTATDFVPSVLAAFVSRLEGRGDARDAVGSLRHVLVGGEAANAAVVHRLRGLLPQVTVTNTFGPTECSIGSVFHTVNDADRDEIPIGLPIDNTAVAVLGEAMRPVPPGEVGELYLGGECVGAGYLDDPARTAEAFVDNPIKHIPGAKLYRTGDLGRVDERGLLRFAGRLDDQVKIRGVRIELGEIDTVVARHPDVGLVSTVVSGQGASATLVTCVTARTAEHRPDPHDVRASCQEHLPSDAVPQRVLVLDAIPLSHNGKVDRRKLAEAVAARLATQHEPDEAAQTWEEHLVARHWADVLELDEVPVTVPFGDLGGSSLSAYVAAIRITSETNSAVPTEALLAADTVRAQAELISVGGLSHSDEPPPAHDLDWTDELRRPVPQRLLLVTGATGFIGSHLVGALLDDPHAGVICLVRAPDDAQALHRLRLRLTNDNVMDDETVRTAIDDGRLAAVAGDLSRPLLGLTTGGFRNLARIVDGVVHAGALVNLVASYATLAPTNVYGVRELARFCVRGGGLPLHVMSTLSVFPSAPAPSVITEDQSPSLSWLPQDGYSRSKLVAELLLADPPDGTPRSTIYRLGEVWPHSATGVDNPRSVAHNVLYACAYTGARFPSDAMLDVTPVDTVARFVSEVAMGAIDSPHSVFHVLTPSALSLDDALDALGERIPLDKVDYAEFRARVMRSARVRGVDERLQHVGLVLPPDNGTPRAPAEFDALFSDTVRRFGASRFQQHTGSTGPAGTAPAELLEPFLDRLARQAHGVPTESVRA